MQPLFIFTLAYVLFQSVKWAYKSYFYRLHPHDQAFLYANLKYYRCLDADQRKKFDKRVAFYLGHKIWDSRKNFQVSREVRLLVSAIAVQVTFGFDAYTLPFFKHIILYPGQYFSNITKKFHKGEVNLNGVVVLNWEDLKEGIKNDEDGLNLGIHEFAHAVYFENLEESEDYFFIEKPVLQRWYDVAAEEREAGESKENSFFREYAYTNIAEFWAVSAENFFERPEEFKKEMPEYYDTMVKVFKQDPAKIYAKGELLPPTGAEQFASETLEAWEQV